MLKLSIKIFEIQDELNESALDTAEDLESPNGGDFELTRQRTLSPTSHLPLSQHVKSPEATSPPPVQSPPQQIRARVSSQAMHEGMSQSFTSPLAQFYQPLVLDTGEPETPAPPLSPPSATSGVVSYGPTTRRRLSSVQSPHRRVATDGGTSDQYHIQGLRRFPLSESPTTSDTQPPTAGQVKDDEDAGEDISRLMKSIIAMEERQERIEEMLKTLLEEMKAHH